MKSLLFVLLLLNLICPSDLWAAPTCRKVLGESYRHGDIHRLPFPKRVRQKLQAAIDIGLESSEIIRSIYDSNSVAVEMKADDSPVTEADRRASLQTLKRLRQWDPSTPAVSEEGDLPSFEVRKNWKRYWLLDPVDGTKEFIRRTGEFTYNLALIEDGRPVLGVLIVPMRNLLYFAVEGHGSWRQEGDGPIERIYSEPPKNRVGLKVVEGWRYEKSESDVAKYRAEIDRTLAKNGLIDSQMLSVGSSWKFAMLAEGRVQVNVRVKSFKEWDAAAGDAIFRNSGRNGLRASPMVYGKTTDFKIPPFILGLE